MSSDSSTALSLSVPLIRRWILACVVGEGLGLTLSGTIGAVAPSMLGTDPSPASMSLVMVMAGGLEGLVVALCQYVALRGRANIDWKKWIPFTTLGFAVGWAAGGLLSAVEPEITPNTTALIGMAIAFGAILGAVLGLFQAMAWASTVGRPAMWIPASCLAWMLGMVVSFFGAAALQQGPYEWQNIFLGLVTGAAVGLAVGAVSALPFARLSQSA